MATLFVGVTIGVIPRSVAADVIFGNAVVESENNSDTVGQAEAFTMTANSTAAVGALNVYVDTPSTATNLVAGIYTDGGQHPGTLIVQGSLASPAAGRWNSVVVPTTTVTSGKVYWVTILGAGGGQRIAFRDRPGGGGTSETSAQVNLSTLPGTWTTGQKWSPGPPSIYGSTQPLPPPPPPSQVGAWSPVMNWPLVAIHSMGLHTGGVLLADGWGTPNQTEVFDPATLAMTSVPNTSNMDLFCSANVSLADGRVLIVGGDSTMTHSIDATHIFDPVTNGWTRVANLKIARWYATATELGDGRVLVISGSITTTSWADTPEIYDPVANTWTLLSGINTSQVHEDEYPLSYLAPNGKVFTIAPKVGKSFFLDPAVPSWGPAGGPALYNGSAATYLPGKILYTGGGTPLGSTTPATTTSATIDLNSANPTWQPASPMNQPRYTHTLTVLPDGNVLAVGGSNVLNDVPGTEVLPAEEWNPQTGAWTVLASMDVPRMYHSTAVLVPDGRVLVAGSGHDINISSPGQYNAQFYSPPYLFKGPRPSIGSIPGSVQWGSTMTVGTPDAASISSVSLVSLGADTHTLDMNQHFVPMPFTAGSGSLTVSIPSSPNVAPPGYYMVFIVNSNGVPSTAAMIHVGTPVDTTPPTVAMTAPPAGATVSGTSVSVAANATDNIGVSRVQFLVDGTPLGPPVTSAPYATTWDTTSVGNGAHALSAKAYDAAGNVGTANPVNVTVANSPPTGIVVDASSWVDGKGTVTTQITTPSSGDLLLAFVGYGGPSGPPSSATLSGGGLTWTLLRRANRQAGDAEVWSARATGRLSGASITSTPSSSGYPQSLMVVALTGAGGTGATAQASAPSGAPSVQLTTTKAGSVVFGVGNDYDNALARTLGPGQRLIHQWPSPTLDTFWSQYTSSPAGAPGSVVTINDTAPTADQYNLAAVEVIPSG